MRQKPLAWLVIGALLGLGAYSLTNTSASAQAPRVPQQWEYETLQASFNMKSKLNALGAQGWELVASSPCDGGGQDCTLFVLKRPKP